MPKARMHEVTMSDRPNIIWSNENLDYADWQESLAEDYPDLTEAEREALMYELSADHLDAERTNLNIQLSHSRKNLCLRSRIHSHLPLKV